MLVVSIVYRYTVFSWKMYYVTFGFILTFCWRVFLLCFNPLSANPRKWSNTLKQFVGNLPTNCLSVFGHFLGLALKGLKHFSTYFYFGNPLGKLSTFYHSRNLILTFWQQNCIDDLSNINNWITLPQNSEAVVQSFL